MKRPRRAEGLTASSSSKAVRFIDWNAEGMAQTIAEVLYREPNHQLSGYTDAVIAVKGDLVMAATTSMKPVLLMKKLGGMISLILGTVLTALGYSIESTATTLIGVVLLVAGAIVLALKIIRRNQGRQSG